MVGQETRAFMKRMLELLKRDASFRNSVKESVEFLVMSTYLKQT